MKTIREVIAVLDGEIYSWQHHYRENPTIRNMVNCLKRARQIVKASQRGSAKKKGKR